MASIYDPPHLGELEADLSLRRVLGDGDASNEARRERRDQPFGEQ